jgi:hypothetical protein
MPRPCCSTAFCCASGRRARRNEPATFLLDRVAEDMAERLRAVIREFKDAADVGTASDQVRNALTDRAQSHRRATRWREPGR